MARSCPPNSFAYNIKAGDTIYSLARQYETTVSAIISANPGIIPEQLRIGQQICIPQQKQYPSCPEKNYYTIKKGDTFYSIARFFNVSVDDLKEANPGVSPANLIIGNVICIPLATPPVRCPQGTKPYIVKKGETFYSIARKFNTTVAVLRKYNPGINPEALLIGQKICIPSS